MIMRCKDAKMHRGKAVINNKFCCNFTKTAINENIITFCYIIFL